MRSKSKEIRLTDCSHGEPGKILRLIQHILFGVSQRFTKEFLADKHGVNLDMQHLPDAKFYRQFTLLMVRTTT